MSTRKNITFWLTVIAVGFISTNSYANSITISPPMMLDTGTSYQASQGTELYDLGAHVLVGQGESVNLILVKNLGSTDSWTYIRALPFGDVIDTIPRALPGSREFDTSYRFDPLAVYWTGSNFCIVGTKSNLKPRVDSLAVVRMGVDGRLTDEDPATLDAPFSKYTEMVAQAGDKLWLLKNKTVSSSTPAITADLYSLSSASVMFRDTIIALQVPRLFLAPYAVSADTDRLLLSFCSIDGTLMRTYTVSTLGGVTALDSMIAGRVLKNYIPSLHTSLYGADSLLIYFVDSTTGGGPGLQYYFVRRSAPTGTAATLTELPFPGGVGSGTQDGTLVGQVLHLVSDPLVWGYIDVITADLAQNHITQMQRLAVDTLRPAYITSASTESLGSMYYFSKSGVHQLRWNWSDPVGTATRIPGYFRGLGFRCPTIMADSSGFLMYAEVCRLGNQHLRGYRIQNPTTPVGVTKFELMEGYKSHYPSLFQTPSGKVLIWNEEITDSIVLGNSDTTIQHRLVRFTGDAPSVDQISKAHRLKITLRSWDFRPNCVEVDSTLYVANTTGKSTYEWGSQTSGYLCAIREAASDTSTTFYNTSANGLVALIARDSGVDWIGSLYACTTSTPSSICRGYIGSYMVDTYSRSGVTHDPRLFWNGYYYSNLPNDVPAASSSTGAVVVLQQEAQVYEYSASSNGYSSVKWLGPYLGSTSARLRPLVTPTRYCILAQSSDLRQLRILVFDHNWAFIDSSSIPLSGIPIDMSEFSYDAKDDVIGFSYSSFITEHWASTELFFQTIKVDGVTGIHDQPAGVPAEFYLSQNYPNPFNASTVIQFELPGRSNATIELFNILGQLVWSHDTGPLAAGMHRVSWDGQSNSGKSVSSGVYFCRLKAGTQTATRKLLLLK